MLQTMTDLASVYDRLQYMAFCTARARGRATATLDPMFAHTATDSRLWRAFDEALDEHGIGDADLPDNLRPEWLGLPTDSASQSDLIGQMAQLVERDLPLAVTADHTRRKLWWVVSAGAHTKQQGHSLADAMSALVASCAPVPVVHAAPTPAPTVAPTAPTPSYTAPTPIVPPADTAAPAAAATPAPDASFEALWADILAEDEPEDELSADEPEFDADGDPADDEHDGSGDDLGSPQGW